MATWLFILSVQCIFKLYVRPSTNRWMDGPDWYGVTETLSGDRSPHFILQTGGQR